MVGPILAEAAKHLPTDLKAFVQQGISEGLGAIYVSMGTAARLTKQELHSLRNSLASLPNPVLWKLAAVDLPGNMSKDALAATNIKIINWAPQNDVLGDPAVKIFVTHAGSNSIYEAAYHGKPVVCIPLLADQLDQAAKARYHGFGLTVTPAELASSKPLHNAIQQILDEPQFTAAAQKVQKRLLNKPRHPAQLAADFVERVVATAGETYLDTQAQTLSWWQLSLLDVKLFLAVAVTALLCVLGGLLWVTATVLIHVALPRREKISGYVVQIIAMAENPISKAAKDVQQKAEDFGDEIKGNAEDTADKVESAYKDTNPEEGEKNPTEEYRSTELKNSNEKYTPKSDPKK
ncbi:MAG: UDP-Glycosyltransferase glycogen phosphorylase [Trebouxia sp. A1-2]|nr:MAG: UDP-Glycosyltransferase glycogen phosphorylase [Trebouxia sp. A1-2]